ncbi:8681_t:CDS:1 [Paraglomus brasilianum]|uniref:8681_t:CDS:1 n=1 Tax=Paraglomus brasilianum TaxID=144538 RepID=A0A9N9B8I7_9GLOM|nr:8681_t:CDS:1 [Paraglomus brasilianum]
MAATPPPGALPTDAGGGTPPPTDAGGTPPPTDAGGVPPPVATPTDAGGGVPPSTDTGGGVPPPVATPTDAGGGAPPPPTDTGGGIPNATPTDATPLPTDATPLPTDATPTDATPTDATPTDSASITDSLTDTLSTLTTSTASIEPTSTQTPNSPKHSKTSTGLIAAISGVAVAAAIVLLVLGIWFCRRRKYKTYRRPATRTETKDAQIGYILRGEGNVNPFIPSDSMTPPVGGITRGEDQRSSISTNNAGHSVADSIAEVPATSTDSRRASIVVPTPITRVDIRKLDAALNTIQGRDPFGDPIQQSTEGSTSVRSSPANSVGNYGAYYTSTPPLNQGGSNEGVPSSLNNNGSSFRPMETAHVQDSGSVGSRSSLQSTGNYGGTDGRSRALRQQQLGQSGGSFDLGHHRGNDSVSSTSGQSTDDRVKELLLQRGFL